MIDRAAIDTIKGYFYQFDYSISCILNLKEDNDSILIEGIEDVDVSTATDETAIQCKYYSKTEYNHSVIAEPIRYMLSHFAEIQKEGKRKIKYKIRGCYKAGQHKLKLPLNVELLKKQFLTYVHRDIKYEHQVELGLSDSSLIEFISYLEIDINAKEFEIQFNDLIKDLKSIFKCSNFSSEFFYYNNALRVIKELSIKSSDHERTITKKEFLNQINTSKILFNEWFIKLKGETLHFQMLKKEYFSFLNVSPHERFFLIEINPQDYTRSELKELILIISKKWSKLSKREPKPFCPYIHIHRLGNTELIELKKELLNEGYQLLDGFDFEKADFNPRSITKRPDYYNQVKLKFINSIDQIDPTLSIISKTREVYQFFFEAPFFQVKTQSVRDVLIQVKTLSNIKHMI
jgi:hypothetical protein